MPSTSTGRGRGRPPMPNPQLATRDLITAEEAADISGVTTAVVRLWFNEGRLQTYKLPGKPRRFTTRRDLAEWLALRNNVGGAAERYNREASGG